MLISEISTDRGVDALCEMTPYISNIVADEELLEELKQAIDPKQATTTAEMLALGAQKVTKLVPIILKKRKMDLFGIIGAMYDKTPEEIAKQRFLTTLGQIRDMAKDKEFKDFFMSLVPTKRNE